jgi:hypothetical protein
MSQGAFMSAEKKLLKKNGLECNPFQSLNIDVFDPSQYCRPWTRTYTWTDVIRKPRPVLARKPVMLDVISIIEERYVEEEPIVTRGSFRVLEVALQKTQTKAERITGEINKQEESRNRVQQESPQCEHGAKFKSNVRREPQAALMPAVVSQVPVPPDGLRETKQQTEKNGIRAVPSARSKERQMDEIVRDRIGVPPQPDGDNWHRRDQKYRHRMQEGQPDQNGVPS